MKIDLSTCPSIMEQRAASWVKANPPKPEPKARRAKPQVYAKPTPPAPKPEKIRRPTNRHYDIKPTPCAEFDAEQRRIAYRDAMKSFATDLPDPKHYACVMPSWAAEVLLTAVLERPSMIYRVHPAYEHRLPELRALGLVNVGKNPMITGFSLDVRKALIAMTKTETF